MPWLGYIGLYQSTEPLCQFSLIRQVRKVRIVSKLLLLLIVKSVSVSWRRNFHFHD